MVAVVAIPAATFLRSPVTTTTRTAGGRVTGAPRGGIVALPRSSRAVSLGRGRSSTVVRSFADADSVVAGVSQAVPELALAGYDTSALDNAFVSVASFILPAWGVIVGTLFVVGTIYKIAFPDKYDEAVYKGKATEMVDGESIDLDNLSEADMAAVAELEAERATK